MNLDSVIKQNVESLRSNPYPGRGIIIGMSPNAKSYVQVYWIMGRSENSRNRIFVDERGFVKTEAFDASKVIDPSLIIYYAVKSLRGCHIVSNGDQTDTILDALAKGGTFENALALRTFEPDPPNYTPRISGIVDLDDKRNAYRLSILKPLFNDPKHCVRQFFNYESPVEGVGHCIHTYTGDGNPLPSFDGEPYVVPLFDDIEETARFYWGVLNDDNKVSLLVKFIRADTGETRIELMNKLLQFSS